MSARNPHGLAPDDIAEIVEGYTDCALWTLPDDCALVPRPPGEFDATPYRHLIADSEPLHEHIAVFLRACTAKGIDLTRDLPDGYSLARLGHHFWLSRNGHGTGFWDCNELIACDLACALQVIAERMNNATLYDDDNGRLYVFDG